MLLIFLGSLALVQSQYLTEIEIRRIELSGNTQDDIECGGFEDTDEISFQLRSGNRNYDVINQMTFSNNQAHDIYRKYLCVDDAFMTVREVDSVDDDTAEHQHACSSLGYYK